MKIDKAAVKAELDADTRDVSALWNRAVQDYNATTGIPLAQPHFKDAQEMMKFGNEGAEQFQSWRHGDKRVDKLRSLFMQNIDFIETGAKQLIAAATPAFPPAAAIGTALTFVLTGCKGQSADYDAIVNFFEDMNNFLQRVTIIEKRVPRKKAYQNALMDVFSSLLHMCAVAHKFIKLGRFKKWAINSILGGDAELADGRQTMDKSLSRLQSATEFAILDNSENMLEKQDVLGNSLANFQQELRRNQNVQERLAQGQALALEGISTSIEDLSSDLHDIKQLLRSRKQEQVPGESASNVQQDVVPTHLTRQLWAPRLMSPDPMSLLSDLEKTRISGTGNWIFDDPAWLAWRKDTSAQIVIRGDRGVGKSYLSFSIYEHLRLLAQNDHQHQICIVYYRFRHDELRFKLEEDRSNCLLPALAAAAVQITDQNPSLRQRASATFQEDQAIVELTESYSDTVSLWRFFVFRFFEMASDFQLYMVFDDVDILGDDTQIDLFNALMQTIEKEQFRIKVVTTRTLSRNFRAAPIIEVAPPQFRHDLRELIRDRLHSSDPIYAGVTRLTKHTKQKLAREIEHHANGLLYAEQLLRFLGGVQRETVINTILDSQMPTEVGEVYGMMLARAQSNLDVDQLPGLKSIIIWAVFALRPLTLREIEQLSAMMCLEEGLADDVLSERLKLFFETTYIDDADLQTPIHSSVLFEEAFADTKPVHLGDDRLQLKLRHDSMKSFFSSASENSTLRTTLALAHYHMFMVTSEILRQEKCTKSSTLDEYATLFCLKHWHQITPSELPRTEQLNICRVFARLIICSQLGRYLCQLPDDISISNILGDEDEWKKTWVTWSELAGDLELDHETSTYWCNGYDNALWPLAKSLLDVWSKAADSRSASKAYALARSMTKLTQYRRLLDRLFDGSDVDTDGIEDHMLESPTTDKSEDDALERTSMDESQDDTSKAKRTLTEIQNLAAAAELLVGPDSKFALAVILNERGDYKASVRELESSLESCESTKEQARDQMQLVRAFVELEDWSQVLRYCDAFLSHFCPDSSEGDTGARSDNKKTTSGAEKPVLPINAGTNVESDHTTPENRSWTLDQKALALYKLLRYSEAACCYRDARLYGPEVVRPYNLHAELTMAVCGDNVDYDAVLDTVMHSFKPIDRLNLLTDPSLRNSDQTASRLILCAGARTKRYGDVVKLYKEVIKTLDLEDSGAPLRVELAQIQWALHYDIPGAKLLLNQVFDSVHDGIFYKLTNTFVLQVVEDCANLMGDILLNEFRNSWTTDDKVQIMLELKDLPNRSLPRCTIMSSISWHGCRLTLARMLQKIGPASELQALLNQMFENCLINLRDSTEDNDDGNIFVLAKVLAMMPASLRYAQFVLTTVNQDLKTELERQLEEDEEDEEDKEGDLSMECGGICDPIATIKPCADPIYICLVCSHTTLCEGCHRIRRRWNKDSKPDDEPDFCCNNGKYLKGPMDSWAGMDSGVLHSYFMPDYIPSGIRCRRRSLTGTTSIKFAEMLEDIEVIWKEAWEDYWSGL